ncbi:hypothetical protein UlMin_045783 [Ulmus minor]
MTRMQRSTSSSGTTGAQPACAACKHQRKKCHEGCILAPYFPAERSREFQAVHKVFGVSNVTKMVKNVSEVDRRKTVDSLIWEACCRQRDPVLGSYAEYRKVIDELKIYKSQENQRLATANYKSLSGLMGWSSISSNNGINGNSNSTGTINGGINVSNNPLSYFHDNGNVTIMDQNPFTYPASYHVQGSPAEKIRQEKNVDSVVSVLQQHQQHSINGFNQQFYLSGQFNQLSSKTIESTIWEGGS